MALIDDSDSPIKGFELIHFPEGLYLSCRGMGTNALPGCQYRRRIRRLIHLEEVLRLAAAHRVECDAPIQKATSIKPLPFDIVMRKHEV